MIINYLTLTTYYGYFIDDNADIEIHLKIEFLTVITQSKPTKWVLIYKYYHLKHEPNHNSFRLY